MKPFFFDKTYKMKCMDPSAKRLTKLYLVFALIFFLFFPPGTASTQEKQPVRILTLDLVNETPGRGIFELGDISNEPWVREKNYQIIPRSKVKKVITDMKIKPSQLNDLDIVIEIGKAVNADVVVFGSYKSDKIGNLIVVIKYADVKKGEIASESKYKGKTVNISLDDFIINVDKIIKNSDNVDKVIKNSEQVPDDSEADSIEREHSVGLRLGYPFIFGRLGDAVSSNFLYFSIFWRNNLFTENLFYEFEIGYFAYKDKATLVGGSTTGHNFPITVAALYQFELTDRLTLYPKVGLGYMLSAISTEFLGSGMSSYLLGKVGLEVDFKLSNSFSIILENPLFIAAEVEGFDISFFYIPNLGVRYAF